MPIPQGLLDALTDAQGAKDDTEAAIGAKAQTAAAAASAISADAAQGVVVVAKTETLSQKRQLLEAVIDAYLQPGGTFTPPSTPS